MYGGEIVETGDARRDLRASRSIPTPKACCARSRCRARRGAARRLASSPAWCRARRGSCTRCGFHRSLPLRQRAQRRRRRAAAPGAGRTPGALRTSARRQRTRCGRLDAPCRRRVMPPDVLAVRAAAKTYAVGRALLGAGAHAPSVARHRPCRAQGRDAGPRRRVRLRQDHAGAADPRRRSPRPPEP